MNLRHPLVGIVAVVLLAGCASPTAPEAGSPPASSAAPSASAIATAAATSAEPSPSPSTATSAAKKIKVPDTLRFNATTVDGRPFEGASLAGQPALFWFWAPWCPTCRGQIDQVQGIARDFDGRVNVIGVGSLDDAKAIDRFAADAPGMTHLSDASGAIFRHFGVVQQSSFVLLDADGKKAYSVGYGGSRDLAQRVADVARLMTEGLLALALGAGMVAAINPCGFALLPAYLSLLVLPDDHDRRVAVGRALALTGAMTLGFVAVFGVFGLVIAPVASGVQAYLPWVTVIIGVVLVLLGVWLLAGRSLPTPGWSPKSPRLTRRLASMIGFGAAYAVASLTCTIGPFLAIVVASFRAESLAAGTALFVAYAVGMGLMVGTAAVAVALTKASLLNRLRQAGRWVPRLAGALMIMVGGYVSYYGWWELRVLDGAAAADPVIDAALRLQSWLVGAVVALGPLWLVVILVGLIGLGLLGRRARTRRALSNARKSG